MSNVYFIGAGPYGEALLTREGYRILKQADCVLYDHLLDDSLLDIVKGECIYVGKTASHHSLPQSEINALLIKKAKQYPLVVRLKGGDSFVFGRGGEEAQALYKEHISFSFVPGISSCIAAAELAGIPVTYRGIASGFQVISAHLKDHELRIEEGQLANPNITLIFLMGLSRVSLICEKLIAAQRTLDTPIAIISQAASPHQNVVCSTLANILEQMKREELTSPAVIVVGEVVKLRNELKFYEYMPLFKKRIMVRKIGEDVSYLTKILRQAGAYVKECQVASIEAIDCKEDILKIERYESILFTSKYAVHACFKALYAQGRDARIFSNKRIVVLGKKVLETLSTYGLLGNHCIEGSHEDVLRYMTLTPSMYVHIKARESMLDSYSIDAIEVYENVSCIEEESDETFDAICFTSASSVARYKKDLQGEICLSIGESTSQALRKKGATYIVQAPYANYESMKDAYIQEVISCTVEED